MKETKKINKLNYCIALLIIIAVICVCIYALKIYEASKENRTNNSILSEYLDLIKINELNDYIVENPNILIYANFDYDLKYEDLESYFKELIIEHNLRENILYMDLEEIKKQNPGNYDDKINEYVPNLDIKQLPAIIIYRNGNIEKIEYVKTTNDIIMILNKYEENYIND